MFKIGLLFCVKHLIKRRKEARILVLTPPARSVCILYNVQNILPYMPVAQPQKKNTAGQNYFLSPCLYTLVYIEWDNIILEKTNIILKKMNARKTLF